MFGREGLLFGYDRGKCLLTLLWPLVTYLLSHMYPLELWTALIVCKLCLSAYSWWKHFQLANVIYEWYRADLRARMRRAGIKPRRAPVAPPLCVLPSKLMVLSAVMVSKSHVGMAAPLRPAPRVTWGRK